MKRSRFHEGQIIGVLREQEAGRRRRMCVASMGPARQRSTIGSRSSAEGRCPRHGASDARIIMGFAEAMTQRDS